MEKQSIYEIQYDCDVSRLFETKAVQQMFQLDERNHQIFRIDTNETRNISDVKHEIMLFQTFFMSCAIKQTVIRNEWVKIYYNSAISMKKEQEFTRFKIIFEGKRKQMIAERYQNYLILKPHIRLLEMEWGKYKYLVLEHS